MSHVSTVPTTVHTNTVRSYGEIMNEMETLELRKKNVKRKLSKKKGNDGLKCQYNTYKRELNVLMLELETVNQNRDSAMDSEDSDDISVSDSE